MRLPYNKKPFFGQRYPFHAEPLKLRPGSQTMLQPDFKQFSRLAREATLVPVVKSVSADLLTPVSAFLAIADREPHAFLLESVERGEQIGRYTFLGVRPYMRVTARKGKQGKTAGTLLSFFDTAGEDWEMNIEVLRSEAKYLGEARGLLFLLDPLRIREVAHDPRIHLTEKERHVPPADYLNDARKLVTFFKRTPVTIPLAICQL